MAILIMSSTDRLVGVAISAGVAVAMSVGGKVNWFCAVAEGDGLRLALARRATWCRVSGTLRLLARERVSAGSGVSSLICSCDGLFSSWPALFDRNLGRNLSMERQWAPRAPTGVLVRDFP